MESGLLKWSVDWEILRLNFSMSPFIHIQIIVIKRKNEYMCYFNNENNITFFFFAKEISQTCIVF